MTILIFLLGCIATACSLTGAILICSQEDRDRSDRLETMNQSAADQADSGS
jgi:hypothetical protein